MIDYRRGLPPLGALVIFEAAARRQSFTRAAEDMGVTQAAVSRQVRALEDALGLALFERTHRGIELTAQGRLLAATMSESLGQISAAVERLSEGARRAELAVAATVAFSRLWLVPRLARFREANPDTRLVLLAQDSEADLSRDDADVAIRYGGGGWKDGRVVALFTDSVYPVCSPGYLGANPVPVCVDDLRGHALISAHPRRADWLDWEGWFTAFGLAGSRFETLLTCNSYADAVQAAVVGEGIALGWHRLVAPLVQEGALVRVTPEIWQTREGYHLVLDRERRQRPAVAGFVNWIRAAAAEAAPPLPDPFTAA